MSDKTNWTTAQWREHAERYEVSYREAMDGWGKTVEELTRHSEQLKERTSECLELQAMLSRSLALLELQTKLATPKPPKRTRGRPSKHHPEEFNLLHWFEDAKRQYEAAKPGSRASDNEVLTWYFERVFTEQGSRASRARSPAFQKKLKSMRNRISDLRNPLVKRNPRN